MVLEAAAESDHGKVLELSKSMDLDVAEFRIAEFMTVKEQGEIIGFGRLRDYGPFTEVATIGVIPSLRGKGIGSMVVNELVKKGGKNIYLTCVIPGFFFRLGFVPVKEFPAELKPKYEFCRSFGYTESQVVVMKYSK